MDVKELLAVLVAADGTRIPFIRLIPVDRRGRFYRRDNARSGVA